MKDISKDNMQAIMDDYYNAKLKVKDIIDKYDLNIPISKLVSIFPPQKMEIICKYCGTYMFSKYKNRSSSKIIDSSDSYCPKCGHKLGICECENCQNARLEEENKLKERIKEAYPLQPTINLKSIDYEATLYLSCIIRHSEDNGLFKPIKRITGDTKWDKEILDDLIEKKIISVSDSSPISAFSQENFPIDYDDNKVIYKINLSDDDINALQNFKLYDMEHEEEKEIITKIWNKINYNIVMRYLLSEIERCGFVFKAGEKTRNLVDEMVIQYSPSQCLHIIEHCIKSAAKDYLQKKQTRKHAANSIITHCYNYINKAKQENWQISSIPRPDYLEESPMEIFLFYNILHLNNNGFKSTINFN